MIRKKLLLVTALSVYCLLFCSVHLNGQQQQNQLKTITNLPIKLGQVDELARFPGCQNLQSKVQMDSCSRHKFAAYVYENIHYPRQAAEENISGIAIVNFLVDTSGTISDIQMVSDPGGGIGRQVVRVIQKMKKREIKWVPGKKDGEKVVSRYYAPVVFELSKG